MIPKQSIALFLYSVCGRKERYIFICTENSWNL